MAQSPCFSRYFVNPQQVQINKGGEMRVVPKIPDVFDIRFGRPFVPVFLVEYQIYDGIGYIVPMSLATHKAHKDVFLSLWEAFYKASVNSALGTEPGHSYLSGAFDQYLYKRLAQKEYEKSRYDAIAAQVWNFYDKIDPLTTPSEFLIALDSFMNQMIGLIDRELFAPPSLYNFDAVTDIGPLLETIALATAGAFRGFGGIEINTSS